MKKIMTGRKAGVALALAALLAATGCGNAAANDTAGNAVQTAVTETAGNAETEGTQETDTAPATADSGTEAQTAPVAAEDNAQGSEGAAEESGADTAQEETAEQAPETEDGATEESAGNAAAVTADALYTQISSGVALPQMFLADSGYAENFLGLDMSKVGGFVFALAEDVTRVDSIILIEATDEAAAGSIAALLENYRVQKVAETDPAGGGYQVELHDDIAASSVGKSGRYVWLIVSPDRAAIEGIVAGAWR